MAKYIGQNYTTPDIVAKVRDDVGGSGQFVSGEDGLDAGHRERRARIDA